MNTLSYDNIRKLLFDMNVYDVLNYCKSEHKVNAICRENNFWIDYIEANYDTDLLYDYFHLPHNDRNRLFEILKAHGYYAKIRFNIERGAGMALYMEASKIIKNTHLREGFPVKVIDQLFSRYESIELTVQNDTWIIGNDIITYIDEEDELAARSLRGDQIQLQIKNNLSKHESDFENILIDDITIDGIPLFDIITDNYVNHVE